MAENRFAKYKKASTTSGNRFSKYKTKDEPQRVAAGKTSRERPMGETLADIGMSAAQGIQSGIQSLVGGLGDVQQATGDAVGWVAGKMGASPDLQGTVSSVAKRFALPGITAQAPRSEQVSSAVEGVTGPVYQPKTTAGQYAKTIGEFAPGAVAGPGGVIRKGAMAVVPGAMSEAFGQATEGTAAEPYARIGGALAGGVASAGRSARPGTKKMLKDVGRTDKAYARIENETNRAYNQLRSAGIKYDANAVDAAIQDVQQLRINPNLAPDSAGLRDEFAKFATKGMDFQDLDELEQMATGIIRHHATKPADKFFTTAMLQKIRDVRERGAIATNGSIPADAVKPLVAKAKDLARRRIIARDIGKMKDKAEWYVSGPESGLRNQFRSYGSKNAQNLSKTEQKAFDKVVNREGVLNPLHNAGSRMGQIALGSVGYALGDVTGAIVPVIGSNLARKVMEVYTRKGVDEAIKTVLAGRSAQEKAAVRDLLAKHDASVRAAISGEQALRQQEPFLTDARGQTYGVNGQPTR